MSFTGRRSAFLLTTMSIVVWALPAGASSFAIVADLGGSPRNITSISSVLATDADQNLYSEVIRQKGPGSGSIYVLSAQSGYAQAQLLYMFEGVGPGNIQGGFPVGGPTLTPSSVILGTNSQGGSSDTGTLFDLGTASNIALNLLHTFSGGTSKPTDGSLGAGLVAGPYARYYGATTFGGTGTVISGLGGGKGTLFQVSPSINDPRYKVLYRFGGRGDGYNPSGAKLAVDKQDRLYGVTYAGGAHDYGTVFRLQHSDATGWQEQVLYSFRRAADDVNLPAANIVLDGAGNLYGCAQGGRHGQGGVFELIAPTDGVADWQERVLYNFGDQPKDPVAAHPGPPPGGTEIAMGCGIAMDPTTDLIVGTSYGGGTFNEGTIFTLAPPAEGQTAWTETIGYAFKQPSIGNHPIAEPLEVGGLFYGGTSNSFGDVWAFKP